jgi:hypothetical protein
MPTQTREKLLIHAFSETELNILLENPDFTIHMEKEEMSLEEFEAVCQLGQELLMHAHSR